MRNIARAVVTFSVLALVAACGAQSSGDDAATTGDTNASEETSNASGSSVVSVSMRRTGGLKPITVDRTFSTDEVPPEGFDQADVDAVIAAANAFAEAGSGVNPVPRDTCCDRYTYTITLTYTDGFTETYTTIDGVKQPELFFALVRAVA